MYVLNVVTLIKKSLYLLTYLLVCITNHHDMTVAELQIYGAPAPLMHNFKQEGHDGPEIAHLSLLTKHAPSSFPVT